MAIEETGQNRAPPGDKAGQKPPWQGANGAGRQDGGLAKFDAESLATGLGWFSLGLGLTALALPGSLARLIGLDKDPTTRRTLQAIGLREITSGLGILTRPRPTGWVWSRVAGDAMDLALLGKALTSSGTQKALVGAATAAVAGVTALDVLCGERLSSGANRAIHVAKAITIGRPAEELYRFWRNFENLSRFMQHLESVKTSAEGHSHWKVKAPLGRTVEWDAEITEDQPNRRIAWRSLPGAEVANTGSVRFEPAPGKRGTIVRVELSYQPPAGPVGATFAKLFGKAPDQQVHRELRHFKQIMEIGEVVQSDATVKGWGSAQPSAGTDQIDGIQS